MPSGYQIDLTNEGKARSISRFVVGRFPPPEFSPEEAEIWRLTVGGMKPDWFGPEVQPLLRCYCVEAVMAEYWGRALREALASGENSGRWARWLPSIPWRASPCSA